MNKFYNTPEMLKAVSTTWKKEKSVVLHEFFTEHQINLKYKTKKQYIPDMYRYEELSQVPIQQEIRQYVKKITHTYPLRQSNKRLSAGDYTIMHDHDKQAPGIIALYFPQQWDKWGGNIVFMKNGKTIHNIVPAKNTLLIVERKKGVKYFIKYINHHAKNKLIVISG